MTLLTLIAPATAETVVVTTNDRAWNYGTLKSRVAAWGERSDLTDYVADFVDYAHEEICRRLRASVNTATADLTIDGEIVALPSDFAAFRRLYINVTPRRMIRLVGPGVLASTSASFTTASYPTVAAIEGSNIVFAPVPGSTTTGKLLYWCTPATFVDDEDTNIVLAKYPFLYLYASLSEMFRYIEDDNNADRYQVKFDALIDDINRRENYDAMSGDIMGVASGMVV